MCNFLSALVVKNGDVLTHPMLDSHADLVTYYQLPDGKRNHSVRHFVKVELTPVDWADASTWQWKVDEEATPAWWDDVAEAAEATLRARAQRMVLKDVKKTLIVDGCWIICGTSKVKDVRAGRIVRVQDSAQVHDVCGSAQVYHVYGSAQVHSVGGSAQVHSVQDFAQVRGVGGFAQVHNVQDFAQVHDVCGFAQVHDVCGSAQVRGVYGSAQVRDVRGSAQVHGVQDFAQVHGVHGSAVLDASAKAHVVA